MPRRVSETVRECGSLAYPVSIDPQDKIRATTSIYHAHRIGPEGRRSTLGPVYFDSPWHG